MDKILRLDRATRRRLINRGRKTKDPHTALRFLMIAKLGQGLSRRQVARDLACVPSTVVRAARRFAECGEEGLLDRRAFNGVTKADELFREELSRVLLSVPTEFGWQRPTWTRELLCLELERRGLPRVAACTMGRALSALGARLGTLSHEVRASRGAQIAPAPRIEAGGSVARGGAVGPSPIGWSPIV